MSVNTQHVATLGILHAIKSSLHAKCTSLNEGLEPLMCMMSVWE